MNAHPALPVLALVMLALTACARAEAPVYTSVCVDTAGGQRFFIEEHISDARHTALKVAKIDLTPTGEIARVLVFEAVPGGIQEGDADANSDLLLVFSSAADQYQLIRKAHIALATEGETGPIIEDFRLHHDNGQILQVIDDSAPVACVASGQDSQPGAPPAGASPE